MAAHSADLELARLCAEGDERAWERFVREYRPLLYRAADALDRTQGAREIADSLYADLYGIANDAGERQSLFRYYQGRSSLATWLRAVLAQRYVDRVRVERRVEPLSDKEPPARGGEPDPDRARFVVLIRQACRGSRSPTPGACSTRARRRRLAASRDRARPFAATSNVTCATRRA